MTKAGSWMALRNSRPKLPQDASNGLGCDYHPSLVTHEIMADLLTATLQIELGW